MMKREALSQSPIVNEFLAGYAPYLDSTPPLVEPYSSDAALMDV